MQNQWTKAQQHEKDYYVKGKNRQWKTPHSLDYWLNFLHLEKLEGKGIEVGCGPNGLYNFTDKVVGIDSIDYGKPNFILGRAEKLPITRKVDFVICCNALDHFENVDVSITEMLRITDKIILWTNVFPSWLSRILGVFDATHPYHFTKKGIVNLLKEHGLFIAFFDVKNIYSIHGRHASLWAKTKLFFASVLGVKGMCLHLEAKK